MTTIYCPACLKEMPEDERLACPNCNEPRSQRMESETERLTPQPPGSAIEVFETSPDRRIFHIRRGRGGWQGFFAVCWLAFVIFFTVGMFGNGRKNGNEPLGAAAAISVFWLVGFGMLYASLRQRYMRTIVLLERERLVIERNLFGWKSADQTSLAGVVAADLVVAYEENYKPVFAVRVSGVEKKIQFGAALDVADKNWLVDEINGFLSRRLPGDAEPEVPDDIRDATDDDLEAILMGSRVTVDRSDSGTLRLTRSAFELPGPVAAVVAAGCVGFAGVWYAFLAFWLMQAAQAPFPLNLGFALFAIPFVIAGLLPVVVAAFALWGSIRIDLGPEEVHRRYAVGPLGYTRRLQAHSIDAIGAEGPAGHDNPRWRSRPKGVASTCTIHAGAKSLSLPVVSSAPACHALAELIRRRYAL